jgi:hypothetical protein
LEPDAEQVALCWASGIAYLQALKNNAVKKIELRKY